MAQPHASPFNRTQRKALARRLQSADPGLEVMHPNAAGIDVGNDAHYVAVRPNRDPNPVQRFDCFTADLHRLADWLQQCGVTTVAYRAASAAAVRALELQLGEPRVGALTPVQAFGADFALLVPGTRIQEL